jgi:diguanylate cyclase (GGDEF)-like protein
MKKSDNKYNNLSKEELALRIKEMEEVVFQMKNDKNETELFSFPWVGNLGQWHWMVQSNQVVFNEKKVTNLGYDSEEIPEIVGFEFFTTLLHPEDYDRVMENMRSHLMNLTDVYEVEYRIRDKNGNYVWYYDRGKISTRNEKGEPLVVSGIVFDINKNKIMENKLKEANEKLKQLVIRDELTGSYNRRFMIEKLNDEIQLYNRTKLPFSLIMFDIDNFKLVNDNYGHNIGDIVLKKVCDIIMKRIRKTDVLSRWGGEEFIILLPNTKTLSAAKVAETIRGELSKLVIDDVGKVTASFGVSNYSDGDTIDTIVKKADNLMYRAKSDGKNCVRY